MADNYQFTGQAPRFYCGYGNLIALPGDVVTFMGLPPSDGLWIETDQPATDHGPRSWPIADYQPDVNQGAASAAPESDQPIPAPVNKPKSPKAKSSSEPADPALD